MPDLEMRLLNEGDSMYLQAKVSGSTQWWYLIRMKPNGRMERCIEVPHTLGIALKDNFDYSFIEMGIE